MCGLFVAAAHACIGHAEPLVRRQNISLKPVFSKENKMRKFFSNKKGQGLVEYGLIIAGVALICAAAISVFGHKTSDLIGATAAILPGAHPDDNAAMTSGKLIETTVGAAGDPIELDAAGIAGNAGTARLGVNFGLDTPDDFGGLILEP
ncbi:Flp family type IVb pilin [Rhodopirellula baltica]|uniref:Flp family type IVb pilin n=1 Tax=Rhodopirellula baltica TaxID=265606 RepID=UPI00056D3E6E|nr:class III signal peptide-containing protein [Rhodopirellula baltica]